MGHAPQDTFLHMPVFWCEMLKEKSIQGWAWVQFPSPTFGIGGGRGWLTCFHIMDEEVPALEGTVKGSTS